MFSLTVKLINRSRDFFFKTNFCKNFLFLSFTILATKSTQKACTVSLHFVLNNFMEQPLTANCQDSVCDFFKLLHHQHQQQRCCHGNASDDITDDKNKYENTIDQELADVSADAVCALTRRQHFSVQNDVMTAILKLWRHIRSQSTSIVVYFLEEHSCQISSRSDLKRRSLGLFWRSRPNKMQEKENE